MAVSAPALHLHFEGLPQDGQAATLATSTRRIADRAPLSRGPELPVPIRSSASRRPPHFGQAALAFTKNVKPVPLRAWKDLSCCLEAV